MISLSMPPAMNGETLMAELAAAGVANPRLLGVANRLEVSGTIAGVELGEQHRATVTAVVSAHTGAPSPRVVNEATIRGRTAPALSGNATYLALASPTTAQNTAQIKALTRQVNGLLRRTDGYLDATD